MVCVSNEWELRPGMDPLCWSLRQQYGDRNDRDADTCSDSACTYAAARARIVPVRRYCDGCDHSLQLPWAQECFIPAGCNYRESMFGNLTVYWIIFEARRFDRAGLRSRQDPSPPACAAEDGLSNSGSAHE